MISRDTRIHIRAVLLAFLVLLLLTLFDTGPETGVATVAVLLLFYGLVLGGSHFYLAIRGEDGLVPVRARWWYITTLAVLLVAGAAVTYGGDRSIAAVELETVGLVVIIVTLVVYLVAESAAGYRASRSE